MPDLEAGNMLAKNFIPAQADAAGIVLERVYRLYWNVAGGFPSAPAWPRAQWPLSTPTRGGALRPYRRRDIMDTILVVNAGSSSLKFQVFAVTAALALKCLIKGQVDAIGTRPRLLAVAADKKPLIDRSYPEGEVKDVPDAIQAAGAWLQQTQQFNLVAAGHRVVHGGPDYDGRFDQ